MTAGSCVSIPADSADSRSTRNYPNAGFRITVSGISSTTLVSALHKTLHASEQDRADVAWRRQQWKRHQNKVAAGRLILIDETWAKTNMTRLHRRCARGQRLIAKVPRGHRKTLTFVAGLRCDGVIAPCVFDGPIDGKSFLARVSWPGWFSSWCRSCAQAISW